jgi:predicted nucleotidyltransferase component of viral defense system
MNEAISRMLGNYETDTPDRAINALRDILQEVALLGLSRIGFFQEAAFYGGTALRILYGLDRYSEDMDFSLLKPYPGFNFKKYGESLKREIESFGFSVSFEPRNRNKDNPIASAFLKSNTYSELISIQAPENVVKIVPKGQILKIKIEVDTDPPPCFETEMKFHLSPIPFSVRTYSLPDLFAGKIHAVLCRRWKRRTKGRDWYDLIWYVSRGTKVNLVHLEKRMKQTGDLEDNQSLTRECLMDLLEKAVDSLDVKAATRDVMPFLKDVRAVEVWSNDFFRDVVSRVQVL